MLPGPYPPELAAALRDLRRAFADRVDPVPFGVDAGPDLRPTLGEVGGRSEYSLPGQWSLYLEPDLDMRGSLNRLRGQKSSLVPGLACKHVANIQDITRHHRTAPNNTKALAGLDWAAPDATRQYPPTRSSANFKTGVGAKAPRRVRFPSASAWRDRGVMRESGGLPILSPHPHMLASGLALNSGADGRSHDR